MVTTHLRLAAAEAGSLGELITGPLSLLHRKHSELQNKGRFTVKLRSKTKVFSLMRQKTGCRLSSDWVEEQNTRKTLKSASVTV